MRNPQDTRRDQRAADVNDVSLLGQNHPGDADSDTPEVAAGADPPEPEQAEHEEHREKKQPHFVNRIAAVKNEGGRNRHRERGDAAHRAADEGFELQRHQNRADARQHDRQPERPNVPAEKRLREEKNVEMKRPVIIRRVVAVEPGLHHLIDEPAVDPLIEVRRFHAQEEEPEQRAEGDDAPERPVDPRATARRAAAGPQFLLARVRLRC